MRIPCVSRNAAALLAALLTLQIASSQEPASRTPSAERLNQLAHQLLTSAAKTNGPVAENQKPWHLKAEVQKLGENPKKPDTATLEEWYAGPNRFKRVYTASLARDSGSEWSLSKTERYVIRPRHTTADKHTVAPLLARRLTDPLYEVGNLRPQDSLTVIHLENSGKAFNCASLANPSHFVNGVPSEEFMPTMCFDSDLHLRLLRAGDTIYQYDDYQPFAGRSVARNVKTVRIGMVISEMKITQLEPAESVDSELKPAAEAVRQPYLIEAGSPQPVSVFETGTVFPLRPDGTPFRGTIVVPVIIRQDGSVSIEHGEPSWTPQAIVDAANSAVSKWKFKPYLIDGQPVEALYSVLYPVDGKPFVPSYQRTQAERNNEPPVANAPNSADTSQGAQRGGRRR